MTSTGAATRPEVPYGAWPSPLGLDALTARTVVLGEPRLDAVAAWWVERRPENDGLATLVRCPDGGIPADVTLVLPEGDVLDARSRVYEYGGLAYDVADGTVVACHGPTSRLYRADVAGDPAHHADVPDGLRYPPEPGPISTDATPLTPAGAARFGSPHLDLRRGLVYAVREDHGRANPAGQPTVDLVAVPLDGSAAEDPDAVRVLLAGRDFVASPALSPDGRLLACVAWDHPGMPWTSSELLVIDVDAALANGGGTDPSGTAARRIAGGDGVAVQSPVWGPDNDLVFFDDSTGYTNPYRAERQVSGGRSGDLRVRALHRSGVDLGMPQWGLGQRVAAMLDEDHLVAVVSEDGRRSLMALRRLSGEAEEWQSGWAPLGGLDARDGRAVLLAASETEGPAIVRLDLASATSHVLRRSAPRALDPADVSRPEPLSWPVTVGDDEEPETAHGFFYAPVNSAVTAPAGELPPVLVVVHGGPTAATSPTYSTVVQFWTTRGFAVLDVNYGGSTGYGRAYQDRLEGRWGLVDVADCAAGVRHLADTGRVDAARAGIRGGSAGGFTVLAALTSTDVFTAGASYYGVADLEALARDTHKFESRYLDGLVAPYPAGRDVYRERSPIDHLDRINAPVVILQGSDDAVVPMNQATMLADALREKGLPVALRVFDGEGHGFRKAANIQAAAAAELSFLGQVWGFTPAGDIPVLEVENLGAANLR